MIININNDVKVNSDTVFAYKLKFGINWDEETKDVKLGRYTKHRGFFDILLRRPFVHEMKTITHSSYKGFYENPLLNDGLEEDVNTIHSHWDNRIVYSNPEQPRIVLQSAGDNKKTIFFDTDQEAEEYFNQIGVEVNNKE